VAGIAVCDDQIVIDLPAMQGVRVDLADGSAWGAGLCAVGDVDHETQAHGLATTGAIVSHTGVAGLSLGAASGDGPVRFGVENGLAAPLPTTTFGPPEDLLRQRSSRH
jgi:hypothetical protein